MAPRLSTGWVEPPRLLLILDREVAEDDATWLDHLGRVIAIAPRDGSVWVQLRAKRLTAEQRHRLFVQARPSLVRDLPTLINGNVFDALAAGFTGVHWPEAVRPVETPPAAPGLTHISAAVHDLEGARAAARVGAQVVTWSPVFDPGSKPGTGRGLDALADFAMKSPLPTLALGGVTADRVRPCLDAGAVGVATLSSVSRPNADVEAAVQALLDAAT